jgi:hypothetical protein
VVEVGEVKFTFRKVPPEEGDALKKNRLPSIKGKPGGASFTSALEGIYPVMTTSLAYRGEEKIVIPAKARIQLLSKTDSKEGCIFAEDVVVRLHGGFTGRVVKGCAIRLLEK